MRVNPTFAVAERQPSGGGNLLFTLEQVAFLLNELLS
jgi:hypothetical protein